MKYLVPALVFAAGFLAAHLTGSTGAADPKPAAAARPGAPPPNPNIDMNAFLANAQAAATHRESRRLSEDDFVKTSREPSVIILDARSKEMYDLLHVKGAINLSFPDIDAESVKKVLPDKDAKILIYCNNNFTPAPGVKNPPRGPADPKVAAAFKGKGPAVSLNLSTQVTLFNYGYKNVYELAPLVDPAATKLELVSSQK
jgi:hypothetical protein